MKSSKKSSASKASAGKSNKNTLRDLKPLDKKSGQVRGGQRSNNPDGKIGPETNMSCDQALKENFTSVDLQDTLERLSQMPIETWNYKQDGPEVRHISPMAQNFAAAFPLGSDDKHISMIDAHGVAFASIQALHQMVQNSSRELKSLRAEVKRL